MAGSAVVTIKVDVTGLGEEINISNQKTMTVPVEVEKGYTVVSFPAWVTSTSYSVGDRVSNGTSNYYCLTAHTSGVFATDLAAVKWELSSIQLFATTDAIALSKIYGVYIKAEVGTIYITIDTAGHGTLTSATADLVLNVGESAWLPINPAGNLGILVDASAITDAFSWLIVSKA